MSKENKPYFPFYPREWISNIKVQTLTLQQQAIYFNLLCYQWRDGLPDDIDMLARLLRCDDEIAKQSLCDVIDKFFVKKNGKIFNKKLEKIREEITEFSRKKSEAGKKGNEKRWKNSKGKGKTKSSQNNRTAIAQRQVCDESAKDLLIAKVSPASASASANNTVCVDIPTENEKKLGEQTHTKSFEKELKELAGFWNSKIPRGYTGKNKTVCNDEQLLPPCKTIPQGMVEVYTKLRLEFDSEDFETAVQNYAVEILGRASVDGRDYDAHRFTMFEFLKKENGFLKFVETG